MKDIHVSKDTNNFVRFETKMGSPSHHTLSFSVEAALFNSLIHLVFQICKHISSFLLEYLFIFGCTGLHCYERAFSTCGEWGLLSSCGTQASCCGGFFCCVAWAPWHAGFSGWGAWASIFVAHGLQSAGSPGWHLGLVVLQHVGSSWTRD